MFKKKFSTFTIAMVIALVVAGIVGTHTGKTHGLADIPIFAGVAIMGGHMLRDYAVVATAYGGKI